jgi:Mrp family chromosome partitioning ATPase
MDSSSSAVAVPATPDNANAECVGPESARAGTASSCEGCPNQASCASGETAAALAATAQTTEQLRACLGCVSHVILVLSGKGGVGKSTVATQLALTLAERHNLAVGLLDVDLCGPSAPRMALGGSATATATIHKTAAGLWIPVYKKNLAVMSISFLLPERDKAVIWRGPRKNALIQQFLTQVDWSGDTDGLDYLIIDTPPGTSDEHISTWQKAGGRERCDQDEQKLSVVVNITHAISHTVILLWLIHNRHGPIPETS